MKKSKISKVIAKKTSMYLKISMSLFVFSLAMLSTAVIFIQQQYAQMRRDFVDNSNTHLITITRVQGESPNLVYPLMFYDEKKIVKLIKDFKKVHVFSEYTIPFGINNDKDDIFFIKAVDNDYLKQSGMQEIAHGEAIVSKQIKEEKLNLKIPVINVENNGFSSDMYINKEFTFTHSSYNQAPFDELDTRPDTIIINKETFSEIIEIMYSVSWNEFKQSSIENNPYGIDVLQNINVYVDDLSDIEKVADKLKTNKYEINYVLKAFEDLQGSLNKSYFVYAVLLLFILIVAGFNSIISFRGYLLGMQKDMGILRHYGYSCSQIYEIYKNLIISPYIKIVGIVSLYTFCISFIMLRNDFTTPFIRAFLMIVFFVGVVLFSLLRILNRLSKKEVIILIKQSKEME